MKVKICGLTNLDDALAAVEAGADLLGFNFYDKSPRYIPPETARAITTRVRASNLQVKLVGVFVNSKPDLVQSTLQQVGLDLAQLHGNEPVVTIAQLKGRGFKALRTTSMAEAENDAEWYAPYGPK